MDSTVAAVLAAGIPAAVAATTFMVGEILRAKGARADRVDKAVRALTLALEGVAQYEARLWLFRITWDRATTRVAVEAHALLDAVPRRDRVVAFWFMWKAGEMVDQDRVGRVRLSAIMTAELGMWRLRPQITRDRIRKELLASPYPDFAKAR